MIVPNPDVVGGKQILRAHVRTVPLAPAVDLKGTRARHAGFLRGCLVCPRHITIGATLLDGKLVADG
jgi:ATP-dependent Zn protease